jgi:hypothetical protein
MISQTISRYKIIAKLPSASGQVGAGGNLSRR